MTRRRGVPGLPELVVPPGHRLLRFAELAFSRRSYALVLVPVVRDLRAEYLAALAAGRRWKARWVHLRGIWAFWAAVAGLLPLPVVDWLTRRGS